MALPPRYTHLLGSKFTATAPVEGWRQFHVVGLRKIEGGYDVELRASCDASVGVTIPGDTLFDRQRWTPGWKRLTELEDRSTDAGPAD